MTSLSKTEQLQVAVVLRELRDAIPLYARAFDFMTETRQEFEEILATVDNLTVLKVVKDILDISRNYGISWTEWLGSFSHLDTSNFDFNFPTPYDYEDYQRKITQKALALTVAHVKAHHDGVIGKINVSPREIAGWPFSLDAKIEITRGLVTWYPSCFIDHIEDMFLRSLAD